MLQFKGGVRVSGLCLEIYQMLDTATELFGHIGEDCIVTSARYDSDSHVEFSRHHSGLALDLRRKHLTLEQTEKIRQRLTDTLGSDYRVSLESTHFHVSFKPRYPG